MRYFLDAEANGFGGQLISLALVPADVARLAPLMVAGPGHRFATPMMMFDLLDLPLVDAETTSAVTHNACYDAMALRDDVMRTDR